MIVRVSKPNTMRQKGSAMLVAVVAFFGMLQVNAVDQNAQAGPSRLQGQTGNLHSNQPHQGTSTAHQVGGTRPETIDLGVAGIIHISESQKIEAISDFLRRFRFTEEQAGLSIAEQATIAIGGLLLMVSAIGDDPPKEQLHQSVVQTIPRLDKESIVFTAMEAAFNEGYDNYFTKAQHGEVCIVFPLLHYEEVQWTSYVHTQRVITSVTTVALQDDVSKEKITKILEIAIKLMLAKPHPDKVIDLYEAAASLMSKLHELTFGNNATPQAQALHLVAALIKRHTTNNGKARTFLAIGDYLVGAGKMEMLQHIVIAAVIEIIKKARENGGAYMELMDAVVGITPYVIVIKNHYKNYFVELKREVDNLLDYFNKQKPRQIIARQLEQAVQEMQKACNENDEYKNYYSMKNVMPMLGRVRGDLNGYHDKPEAAFFLVLAHLAFLNDFENKLELYKAISKTIAHLIYIAYRPRGINESVTIPTKRPYGNNEMGPSKKRQHFN